MAPKVQRRPAGNIGPYQRRPAASIAAPRPRLRPAAANEHEDSTLAESSSVEIIAGAPFLEKIYAIPLVTGKAVVVHWKEPRMLVISHRTVAPYDEASIAALIPQVARLFGIPEGPYAAMNIEAARGLAAETTEDSTHDDNE
jgi:hypothetical protein